jgi:hypothetical protein
MTTINLNKYGKPHPVENYAYFVTVEDGRAAALDCKFTEAVKAGKVDITINEWRRLGMYNRDVNIYEGWVKGFFGPTIRSLGAEMVAERVTLNGAKVHLDSWTGSRDCMYEFLKSYLKSERSRMEKKAKEDARKEGKTTWSEPGQLMIPDIGTVLQLSEDWTFRLYREKRNNSLIGLCGKGEAGWGDTATLSHEVTMKAGSELAVDRVYIRQGAGEYSSLSFHLHKGGVLEYAGKTIKAKGRFWAKLSDVNEMKVRIDMGTLAEN